MAYVVILAVLYSTVLYIHTTNSLLLSDFHYFLYIFTSFCIHFLSSCAICSIKICEFANLLQRDEWKFYRLVIRISTTHVIGWWELQPITHCPSVIGCGHLQLTSGVRNYSVQMVAYTSATKIKENYTHPMSVIVLDFHNIIAFC